MLLFIWFVYIYYFCICIFLTRTFLEFFSILVYFKTDQLETVPQLLLFHRRAVSVSTQAKVRTLFAIFLYYHNKDSVAR